MAEASARGGQTGGAEGRTLEMRVAELEDRLAQVTVSEEEMRAFQKVSGSLMARGPMGGVPAAQPIPQVCPCVVSTCSIVHHCIIAQCIITHCTCVCPCQCVCQCQCVCGPCIQSPTGVSPMAGFGRLGM
jgi:hypothetical protein